LAALAPPENEGYFAAVAALSAIDELGPKAASLADVVRAIPPDGTGPHDRFKNYISRLQAHIAN
jgi:hypothetical protein